MTISAELKRAVLDTGLTRYAISKRTGVGQQILGRWLKGERGIDLSTADRIVVGLGLEFRVSGGEKKSRNNSRKTVLPS